MLKRVEKKHFFQDYLVNRKLKRNVFIYCNKYLTVTFDKFMVYLMKYFMSINVLLLLLLFLKNASIFKWENNENLLVR